MRKGEEEIEEEVGRREGRREEEGWSIGGRDEVYRKKKKNEKEERLLTQCLSAP